MTAMQLSTLHRGLRVFLVVVLLLTLPTLHAAAKGGKSKLNMIDRTWKAVKSTCEKTTCSKIPPDEAYNCVNECTSHNCYQDVFASAPLEDGEIDYVRTRDFTSCARKEVREQEIEQKKKLLKR